ncbi:MAG: hypothetical protein OIN87_11825 [Candidatus Methanoperedens sp.]|nr:hypothetical protein [Candidatus Methanoperedens sp.]
METIDKDDILFYISKETLQCEAMEKIGRYLTQEELDVARKGLEWGLTFDIETVYNTIIFEMIQNNRTNEKDQTTLNFEDHK